MSSQGDSPQEGRKVRVLGVNHGILADLKEEISNTKSRIMFQSRYQIGHFYVVILTPVVIKREVEFMGKPRTERYLLGKLVADVESLGEASRIYNSTSPDLPLEPDEIMAIGIPKSLLKQILQEVSEEFLKGKRVAVAIFNVQASSRTFKGKPVRSFQLLEVKEGLEGELLENMRLEDGSIGSILALAPVQQALDELKKILGIEEENGEGEA